MGNFASDLEFGKKYEKEAIRLIAKPEDTIELAPKGCFKPYDFKVNGIAYEVKSDRYAHRTNHIFVEYECNGKPSGLTSTTAEFWVYFVVKPSGNYDAHLIDVAVLKTKSKGVRAVSGGDGGRVRGYLVPIPSLKSSLLLPHSPLAQTTQGSKTAVETSEAHPLPAGVHA